MNSLDVLKSAKIKNSYHKCNGLLESSAEFYMHYIIL